MIGIDIRGICIAMLLCVALAQTSALAKSQDDILTDAMNTCYNGYGQPRVDACEAWSNAGHLSREEQKFAYINLSGAAGEAENEQLAIEAANKALAISPNDPMALNNRGAAYLDLNKLDLALADFSAAIESDSRFTAALMNRAVVYERRGQFDLANADASRMPSFLHDPSAAAVRGLLEARQGQAAAAIADFDRALKLTPAWPKIWQLTGRGYLILKQYDKAIANETTAIRYDPKFIDSYLDRARAFLAIGDYPHALADANTVAAAWPDDPEATALLAEVKAKMNGSTSTASAADMSAIESRCEVPDNQKPAPAMLADCNKAVAAYPDDLNLYADRAALRMVFALYTEALADVNKAIAGGEQDAAIYMLRGSILFYKGQKEDAAKDFALAKKIDPTITDRIPLPPGA